MKKMFVTFILLFQFLSILPQDGTVDICHRDLNGKWMTLSVLPELIADHLTHGDNLGPCLNMRLPAEPAFDNRRKAKTNEATSGDIRLFLNSTKTYLNVEWFATTSASASINIIDEQGRLIKKIQTGLVQKHAINRKRISLEGFAKGVYILEIRTGTDIHVSKFVLK